MVRAPGATAVKKPGFFGCARATALLLLCTLGLAACSNLAAPQKMVLSEPELQRLLQGRFPVEQRVLELFEVRATSPQLRLLPELNRLQAVLDLQARDRILSSTFKGRLDFDAALRWDADDQAVRLGQVRVQDFVLLDMPIPAGARRTVTERVAAALAERVLEGLVLYRLPADKAAQLDKAGVQPAALMVTSSGLEITFAPKLK